MPLNSLAAVLVAGLLLLAVRNNTEQQVLTLLSDEKGFIRWVVALSLVLWIYNSVPREEKVIVGGLLTLAAVAMLLQSNAAIKLLSDFIRGQDQ